jgi:hypothetical protein
MSGVGDGVDVAVDQRFCGQRLIGVERFRLLADEHRDASARSTELRR